jgi:DNA-binding transcriptional ArsR family regulator
MTRSIAQRSDAAFQAVGDRVRRDILEQLREGERSAGEIADRFDISWPAVSRHLRLLREAGLVSERRAGRARLYTLNRASIREIFGSWVAAFDAMWNENLRSLKTYVESRQPPR